MLKDFACNLCGAAKVVEVYASTIPDGQVQAGSFACTNDGHGQHYRVVRCAHCGLLFASPRPEALELENEYGAVEDETYIRELEGRFKTFDRNLKNLARFRKSGDLLDVGCALGVFLSRAAKCGWEVQGIEPSQWCVTRARELFQLPVVKGTYKDIRSLGCMYDVVTMWDVIEHVDDPAQALRHAHTALKDGGILALSTVDAGSLYARLMGPRWPWLMKMHIYYFNRHTMRAFLVKAGFEVLEIKTYGHTISMKYLEYKLKSINKFLYLIVKWLCRMPVFSSMFVTIALGDFMEVYARKVRV